MTSANTILAPLNGFNLATASRIGLSLYVLGSMLIALVTSFGRARSFIDSKIFSGINFLHKKPGICLPANSCLSSNSLRDGALSSGSANM
ncbi:hypothetical protein DERP_007723 [Dermatophagoides pteronyssinus]|uniref:Uncharacterized protein n=1 Tax=Dermatophagoides pteronyssinus TaxID=6956 RepID=A0ABQ8JKJ0_DERPT|nr:hypothetical protein DERP_007723 [Dermatophagoides pteronyssinus]